MRVMHKRDAFSGFETYAYRKDGSRICISESVRAIRDKDGKLLYYRVKIEDISARKKAEEALFESERNLRLWAIEAKGTKMSFSISLKIFPNPITCSRIFSRIL